MSAVALCLLRAGLRDDNFWSIMSDILSRQHGGGGQEENRGITRSNWRETEEPENINKTPGYIIEVAKVRASLFFGLVVLELQVRSTGSQIYLRRLDNCETTLYVGIGKEHEIGKGHCGSAAALRRAYRVPGRLHFSATHGSSSWTTCSVNTRPRSRARLQMMNVLGPGSNSSAPSAKRSPLTWTRRSWRLTMAIGAWCHSMDGIRHHRATLLEEAVLQIRNAILLRLNSLMLGFMAASGLIIVISPFVPLPPKTVTFLTRVLMINCDPPNWEPPRLGPIAWGLPRPPAPLFSPHPPNKSKLAERPGLMNL